VIEHVRSGSGGEQDALTCLGGTPGDQLRQECFANAGISDEHDVGSFGEGGEIEQAKEVVVWPAYDFCGDGVTLQREDEGTLQITLRREK
jgi:hypothetical protein